MKPDIIIEFEHRNGRLIAPSGNPFDYVTFKDEGGGNYSIIEWKFPEPQVDLAAIAAMPAYQAYEANRDKIIEREEAIKEYEKKVIKALSLVMMDEINTIRARLVPPLTAKTAAQMKTAVENKIASL